MGQPSEQYEHPSSLDRPLALTVTLSLIIAFFALEAAGIYPYLAGITALPAGWFTGQALIYFVISLMGIIMAAAAFYGWRRWGVYGTAGVLLGQIVIGLLLNTGKPLEILLKAAFLALLVTFSGRVWHRMR